MATAYPGFHLIFMTTLPASKDDAVDSTVTQVLHATQHNNVADAIIAVETELGVLPKGDYDDVAAAISDTSSRHRRESDHSADRRLRGPLGFARLRAITSRR